MKEREVERLLQALNEAETMTIILEPQSAFNGGIIGYDGKRIIYGYYETINSMMKEFDNEEQALDWFSYNTIRALPYMNEKAPVIWDAEDNIIIYHPTDEEAEIEPCLGLHNSLQHVMTQQ